MRLARMYQQAQAATHAREDVLRIVSHDLRNPLSTIAIAADLMLEESLGEPERKKYLGVIKRWGERTRRMAIADTGPGIALADRQRIFGSMWQVGKVTSAESDWG